MRENGLNYFPSPVLANDFLGVPLELLLNNSFSVDIVSWIYNPNCSMKLAGILQSHCN